MDPAEIRPHSLSPRAIAIAGWIAFVVAGSAFIALAWNVAGHASLVSIDAAVSDSLSSRRSPPLTQAMLVVTHAHSLGAIALWSLVFGAALARLREWYWLLSLALGVGGAMGLNWLLKVTYQRARPRFDEPLLTLDTFSFPSGHTAATTAFYGVLAAFLVARSWDRRVRVGIVALAALAIATVAFSRVYLGAHYPSDVVAAACSSIAWLALCLSAVHDLVRRRLVRM
jgi:membrane-associated phospholipid phosphatase